MASFNTNDFNPKKEQSHNKKATLDRFYFIYQLLKSSDIEVMPLTDGELATLGNTMLNTHASDQDMISLLMPQYVLRIRKNQTFELGYHARVLSNLIATAGDVVNLTQLSSTKDHETGICTVTFFFKVSRLHGVFKRKPMNYPSSFWKVR